MTRAMKAQQDIEKGILGTRLRKRTAVPSQVKPRKKYTFKNISAPETEKPEEAAEVEQPPVPMDQDMEQGVKSEGPNTASAARDESAPGTEKPKKGGRKRKWRRTKSAVKEPPIDEKREEGLQDEPAMNDERPTTSSTSREDQGVRKPVQRADEPAEKKKCSRGGRRVKGMRNGVLPPSKLVVDEQEMEQEGEPALDQEPGTSSPAPAPRVQSPVEGEQYVEPEEAPEVEQPAVPIDEEKGEVKQEVESENPSTSSAAQAEQSPHADDQEFLPGTKAKEGQEEETALEVADSSTSSAAPALRAQSPVEMEQVVQPEEAAEVEQPTVPTDKEKDEVEQEVEPENPSTSSVAPVPSVQTSFEEKQDVEPEKAAEVEDPAVPIDEEKEGMEQGVMSEEPSTSSAAQVEHSPHADKLEILPETKANENQEREPAPDDAEPSTSSAAPAPRAKPPVETEQVVQPEEAPEVEQPAVSNDEEQVEREFEFEGMRTPSAAQRELSPQVDALEVSPEAEANEKEGEVPAPDDAEPSTSFASPAPRAKTPGKRGRGKKRGWNLKKENRQTVQPEPSASNVQEKQDVEQQEEPQKVEPPPPNPIVEEQAVGATEQQRTLSVAQRFPPIDRTRGWSFTTVEATREEPLSSAAAVAEKPAPLEDEQSTSSAAPPAVIYKQGWSFTKTNETPLSSPEAIEEPTAASGPEAEAEAEAAEPAEEQEDPRVVAFMNPPSRSSRFDKRISPCQLVLLNRDGYKPAFIEPPNDDLYDF